MPRIIEYTNKDDKLTPSTQGDTAWTGAGRRIAPAYNEAANLERQGAKDIQAGADREAASQTAGAKQTLELDKLANSQLEDLFHIGYRAPETQRAQRAGGGGGGVQSGGSRGGSPRSPRDSYGAASEILGGADALAQGLHPAGPGGKELNVGAGEISAGGPGFWTNDPSSGKYKIGAAPGNVPGGTGGTTASGVPFYQEYWGNGIGPTQPVMGPNGKEVPNPDPFNADPNNEYQSPIGPNPGQNGWNFYGGPNQNLGANTPQPLISGPGAPPSPASPSWSSDLLGAIGSTVSNWAAGFATPDTQAAGDAINAALGSNQ